MSVCLGGEKLAKMMACPCYKIASGPPLIFVNALAYFVPFCFLLNCTLICNAMQLLFLLVILCRMTSLTFYDMFSVLSVYTKTKKSLSVTFSLQQSDMMCIFGKLIAISFCFTDYRLARRVK